MDSIKRTDVGAVTTCLLLCVFVLSLFQFFLQLYYANQIGELSWPYGFDSNRFIDVALTYYDAIRKDGFEGLLNCCQERSVYSLTLLVTGLPFLFIFNDVKALFGSQFLYVILLNVSLCMTVFRLTSSLRWGAMSVLLFNFFTSGILTGVIQGHATEVVLYQVNFPVAAMFMAMLWIIVEAVHVKNYVIWGVSFTCLLTASFLIRPGLLPLFFATFIPAIIILLLYARKARNLRLFFALAAAIVICALVAGFHYISSWSSLINYGINATFSKAANFFVLVHSHWDKIFFYLQQSLKQTWLFPVFLMLIFIALPKIFLELKKKRKIMGVFFSHDTFQPMFTFLFLVWATIMSYLIPTAIPIQNLYFGLPFLLCVWVLGVFSFFTVWKDFSKNEDSNNDKPIMQHYLFILGIITVFMASVFFARDAYGIWQTTRQGTALSSNQVKIIELRKTISYDISRFIADWAIDNNKHRVSLSVRSMVPNLGGLDYSNRSIGVRNLTDGDVTVVHGDMLIAAITFDPLDPILGPAIGYFKDFHKSFVNKNWREGLDKLKLIRRIQVTEHCEIEFYENNPNQDSSELKLGRSLD